MLEWSVWEGGKEVRCQDAEEAKPDTPWRAKERRFKDAKQRSEMNLFVYLKMV